MRWKVCLGGAIAVVLTCGLCVAAPRLGGLTLILLALGALAIFAYRLL